MSTPLFWESKYRLLHHPNLEILSSPVPGTRGNISIPFTQSNGVFHSPGIGTFGGFFTDVENIDWLHFWSNFVSTQNWISNYEITFPPEFFYPDIFVPQVQACLQLFQCHITLDLNHHVVLESEFGATISKGNRKKLRQFHENGGMVHTGNAWDLDSVIDILEISRRNLGVKLSMSKEQIKGAFAELPGNYVSFIAEIGQFKIASAVVVRISAECLYVLYWGDIGGDWRHFSPVVAIFSEIINYAKENSFRYVDLGKSSLNGNINEGLATFKSNLGALESKKYTLSFHNPINLA